MYHKSINKATDNSKVAMPVHFLWINACEALTVSKRLGSNKLSNMNNIRS